MIWKLEFLPEALDDLDSLDNSIRQPVIKGIKKVQQNPVPKEDGGYGTPLGNKDGNNLTGFFKIKFLKYDIRVVYKLERQDSIMKIIIVSARSDNKVYDDAKRRLEAMGFNYLFVYLLIVASLINSNSMSPFFGLIV